ncbi:unnamed protein product [Amoebophrya sp. A120]|nr:unnamed protein product [Amoebophrya sp. A120]|eukprot:GSA120T00015227001.1
MLTMMSVIDVPSRKWTQEAGGGQEDSGLADAATPFVIRGYRRDPESAAWALHALLPADAEASCRKWSSNVVRNDDKMLRNKEAGYQHNNAPRGCISDSVTRCSSCAPTCEKPKSTRQEEDHQHESNSGPCRKRQRREGCSSEACDMDRRRHATETDAGQFADTPRSRRTVSAPVTREQIIGLALAPDDPGRGGTKCPHPGAGGALACEGKNAEGPRRNEAHNCVRPHDMCFSWRQYQPWEHMCDKRSKVKVKSYLGSSLLHDSTRSRKLMMKLDSQHGATVVSSTTYAAGATTTCDNRTRHVSDSSRCCSCDDEKLGLPERGMPYHDEVDGASVATDQEIGASDGGDPDKIANGNNRERDPDTAPVVSFSYMDYVHLETCLEGDATRTTARRDSTLRNRLQDFQLSLFKHIFAQREAAALTKVPAPESLPVLWCGDRGSSTRLHQDIYGVNFVLQVCGQKKWLLLPPVAVGSKKRRSSTALGGTCSVLRSSCKNVFETRLPFEESTVFAHPRSGNCFEEYVSAANNACRGAETPNAYMATLEPGDLLFVPHRWWHSTVALSPNCVSINQWLQHQSDADAQLGEQISRCLVGSVATRYDQPLQELRQQFFQRGDLQTTCTSNLRDEEMLSTSECDFSTTCRFEEGAPPAAARGVGVTSEELDEDESHWWSLEQSTDEAEGQGPFGRRAEEEVSALASAIGSSVTPNRAAEALLYAISQTDVHTLLASHAKEYLSGIERARTGASRSQATLTSLSAEDAEDEIPNEEPPR